MTSARALLLIAALCAATTVGCGGGSDTPGSITAPGTPAATLPQAAVFQHCLDELNRIRALTGAPALTRATVPCSAYETFAEAATVDLITTGVPHRYFSATALPGCASTGAPLPAENQGITTQPDDTAAVNAILSLFEAEGLLPPGGPGRGHYDTIVDPGYTFVAIGLRRSTDGRFYLTNDFGN